MLVKIDALAKHCDDARTRYPNELAVTSSILASRSTLQAYYALTDESPYHAAALILHPRFTRHYLERAWQPQRARDAIDAFKALYYARYLPKEEQAARAHVSDRELAAEPVSAYEAHLRQAQLAGFTRDDCANWLALEPFGIPGSALSWWLEPTQRRSYRFLSLMAIEVFSIPALADEAERTFSGAKRQISQERANQGPDVLEKRAVMKSLIREGFLEVFDDPQDMDTTTQPAAAIDPNDTLAQQAAVMALDQEVEGGEY